MIKVTAYTLIVIMLFNIIGCTSVYTLHDVNELEENDKILSIKVQEENKITPGTKITSVLLKDGSQIEFDAGRFLPNSLYSKVYKDFGVKGDLAMRNILDNWENDHFFISGNPNDLYKLEKKESFKEIEKSEENWISDLMAIGYTENQLFANTMNEIEWLSLEQSNKKTIEIGHNQFQNYTFSRNDGKIYELYSGKLIPNSFVEKYHNTNSVELEKALFLYLFDWDLRYIHFYYYTEPFRYEDRINFDLGTSDHTSESGKFNSARVNFETQIYNDFEKIGFQYKNMNVWNNKFELSNRDIYSLAIFSDNKELKTINFDDIISMEIKRDDDIKTGVLITSLILIAYGIGAGITALSGLNIATGSR